MVNRRASAKANKDADRTMNKGAFGGMQAESARKAARDWQPAAGETVIPLVLKQQAILCRIGLCWTVLCGTVLCRRTAVQGGTRFALDGMKRHCCAADQEPSVASFRK